MARYSILNANYMKSRLEPHFDIAPTNKRLGSQAILTTVSLHMHQKKAVDRIQIEQKSIVDHVC